MFAVHVKNNISEKFATHGEMLYLCGVVEKQAFIRRKLKYR